MFPARAGMNRKKTRQENSRYCVPRAGGDEPDLIWLLSELSTCSPRGRG